VVGEVLHTAKPMFKTPDYEVQLEIAGDLELDSYPGPSEQVLTNRPKQLRPSRIRRHGQRAYRLRRVWRGPW